ncbi:hypothetical protein CEP52_009821 [Fusarium oligoseptatum]|uniref:Uncharacterized protein n=2 Tax=Fusarium solani species complex TaxID=232080 RepID=A0A428TBC2_9HYPO|nr:hypothetical protein CEP51_011945 [Fusarium floridanum]RSL99330.1 hypothetical protein CEP52_009821 [Fusarium oligoseptatum]
MVRIIKITALRRDMKSQLKIARRRNLFETEVLWMMFFIVVFAMIEADESPNRIYRQCNERSLTSCVGMKRHGNLNKDYDQPWASDKGAVTLQL